MLKNAYRFAGAMAVTLAMATGAWADDVPWATPDVLDAVADGANGVAVGDINNDGDLDVVAISVTDNTLAWYDNGASGHGRFTRRDISADMRGPQRVRLADMDADGWLDIVCTCSTDGAVRVIFNDGTPANGGWLSNPWAIGQGAVVGLAIGDLDRDGDMDIAFSIPGSNRVAWLENDGSPRAGAATARNLTSGSGDSANDLAIADFTRDGFLDVVAANGAGGTSGSGVVWWENDGNPANGGWTRTVVANGQATEFQCILATDINGDNRPDLVAGRGDGTVLWYRSTGVGTFIAGTLGTGVPDPRSLSAGDIDGDSDIDVAATSFTDDAVKWFDNSGGLTPTFTQRTIAETIDGASAVALGDFGEDGDLDAAVCALVADDVGLVENTKIHSTSQFEPFIVTNTAAYDSIGDDFGLDVGDVDNDGDPDIVRNTMDGFDRQAGIVWHECDATPFSGAWPTRTIDAIRAFNGREVIVVDAEGDGDLDVAGQFQTGILWGFGFFLNDGSPPNGGWNQQTEDPVLANRGFKNVFDLDGDGDLDVLIASFDEAPFQLDWDEFRPHDTIKWTRHELNLNPAPQGFITGAAAADLNHDSQPDLVVQEEGSVAWYENPGSLAGVFVRHEFFAGFSGSRFGQVAPVCVDVDRDGEVDVIFRSGSANVIAHNLGGSPPSLPTFARINLGGGASAGGAEPDAGDADRDGDVDLLLPGDATDAGVTLAYLECTRDPLAFVPGPLGLPSGTNAEAAFADVDRDGLQDIVGVSMDAIAGVERVFVIRNRGGQASVTGASAIEQGAGAYDGAEAALLGMHVQHLGRAGDRAAEIAEVRVLFERLPGLLHTPAQVSALFASVAIFRDMNADGALDAGDVLVDRSSISTHTPATNPMVLSIADANTDADVPATQSRDYLITVALRADAHDAAVNTFIATLALDEDEGPVGVDVVDAPSDIPLRLAHSEDAQTGLVTALCIADFNGDRVLNSQDFFDFLVAFFALTPEADFNDDAVINSQDFFDFLVAFFAGC